MIIESEGNLLEDFRSDIDAGNFLAVMPIARVEVEWSPRQYPGKITFYPAEFVDLNVLGIIPNDKKSSSLAEVCSAASEIDQETLEAHPLVVFPCGFNWNEFRQGSYRDHLEFIRKLSDYVDKTCLNFIRYCQCSLEIVDSLPGSAGTINSNHMMAGALLYNSDLHEGRIIGGDAFTHFITRGLGLPIQSIEHDLFPKQGEVGFIVSHALSLYTSLLESSNPTARFIQALGLLEFLAYPDEYKKFEEVKKVISRYVAKNKFEYQHLLNRFFELTGKKDVETGHIIGYRTRLVHMGERIEDIILDIKERTKLFMELEEYIKAVLDHMIKHSDMDFEDYLSIRETLCPYDS